MIFTRGPVDGAWILDLERRTDNRGYFARFWCERELAEHGLTAQIVQANTATSLHGGTLRGMHYQESPFAEVKIMRCSRGAVFDVVVDLRKESPTYGQWMGVELSAENGRMLYAPEGCAHGYITLRDDTELSYSTSHAFAPQAARGVRFDDPAFGIVWPVPVRIISDVDRSWPDFVK